MSLEMRVRQAARRGSRVESRGSRVLRRKVRCKDAQSHGSGPGSRSPTSPLVCDSSKRPTIPLTARRACLPVVAAFLLSVPHITHSSPFAPTLVIRFRFRMSCRLPW
jgi:hypothetical protein